MKKIFLLVAAMAAYVGLQASTNILFYGSGDLGIYELTYNQKTIDDESNIVSVEITNGPAGAEATCSLTGDKAFSSDVTSLVLDDEGYGYADWTIHLQTDKPGIYEATFTVTCDGVTETLDIMAEVTFEPYVDFDVSQWSVDMKVGDVENYTEYFTYTTYLPEGETDKYELVMESDDETVVVVNGTSFEAVGEGSTSISCGVYWDGYLVDAIVIDVYVDKAPVVIESISFREAGYTMLFGEVKEFDTEVMLSPTEVEYDEIEFWVSSADAEVLSVLASGSAEALAKGEVTLHATVYYNDRELSKDAMVPVTVLGPSDLVSSASFNTSAIDMKLGDPDIDLSELLTVVLIPEADESNLTVDFATTDVAVYIAGEMMSAFEVGTATVTAYIYYNSENVAEVTLDVNVADVDPEVTLSFTLSTLDVELSDESVDLGSYLSVMVTKGDMCNFTYRLYSETTTLATTTENDDDMLVNFCGAGSVNIVAKAFYNGVGVVGAEAILELVIRDVETALDNASDKAAVRKTVDKGSLIIIRDGKRYNAMGVRL